MLDRPTLERLYLELEKPLFNLALRWTWNAAEAQELVQDAFVRVWARRTRVDPDTVRPYLYRAVLNAGQNHARRRERWHRVRALFGRALPEPTGPEQSLDQSRLRSAIQALPDDLRQVLLLCEYSDLRQKEIAELLDIPTGTVASRRHTALKRLEEALHGPRIPVEAD